MVRLSILIIVSLFVLTLTDARVKGAFKKAFKKGANIRVDAVKQRVSKEKTRLQNFKKQRQAQIQRQQILSNRITKFADDAATEVNNTNSNGTISTNQGKQKQRMAKRLKHKKSRRRMKHIIHKNPTKSAEYHHHEAASNMDIADAYMNPARTSPPKHHHTLHSQKKIKQDQQKAEKLHALKEKHDMMKNAHSASSLHQQELDRAAQHTADHTNVAGHGVKHHSYSSRTTPHHMKTLHSKPPKRTSHGHHKAPRN